VNALPPPAPVKEDKPAKHGSGSVGVVWVNPVGQSTMALERPIRFPVGSIIVREKFLHKDDAKPELLAVMVKHEKGFSRASGDWEYLLLDDSGSRVKSRQKKGSCNDCHSQVRHRDFVFPVLTIPR
jgi:hypothetical protein